MVLLKNAININLSEDFKSKLQLCTWAHSATKKKDEEWLVMAAK